MNDQELDAAIIAAIVEHSTVHERDDEAYEQGEPYGTKRYGVSVKVGITDVIKQAFRDAGWSDPNA